MSPRRWLACLSILAVVPATVAQSGRGVTSCVACHTELEDEAVRGWARDVHREVGLGCDSCHGGDPSPALAEDPERAMSPDRGYRGAPDRFGIASFCGECHADATFMRQYDPQARVDQLSEYWTSVHGKRNAAGDPVPATCTDCHGVHGILRIDAPDSPVYATNVPKTCARCHADAEVMAPYDVPVDQYEKYMRSTHAAALYDREDIAAPACNDCHGNHGAAPPGVQSLANVCGQCHAREATLFRNSFKKDLFDEMGFAECAVCHGNHDVAHPSPEMFRSGSAPQVTRGSIETVSPLSIDFGELAPGETAEAGWVMTLSPHLTAGDRRLIHRLRLGGPELEELDLEATVDPGTRPSTMPPRSVVSPRLSASLTVEALEGEPVQSGDALAFRLEVRAAPDAPASRVRLDQATATGVRMVEGSVCLTCHAPGDACDQATERMYADLAEANRELRAAEGLLHEAEVAGMDVSQASFELKKSGTTAAVEARALIHTFDPDRLSERAGEAKSIAQVASGAGRAALAELQYRRRGLAVSLVLIALVLIGLFLKIRSVDAQTAS